MSDKQKSDREHLQAVVMALGKQVDDLDVDGAFIIVLKDNATATCTHADDRNVGEFTVRTLRAARAVVDDMLTRLGIDPDANQSTVSNREARLMPPDNGGKPS